MKNWLISHRQSISSTLRRILQSPLSSLLNIAVIGIALSLPAGMYIFLENVTQLTTRIDSKPQMSIFVKRDANRNDLSSLETKLKQTPNVKKYSFISREKALESMRKDNELANILDQLKQNPLPDTFIVWPNVESTETLETLRNEMQRWPQVAHVQLDSLWVKRLTTMFKLAQAVVLLLAILFGFALIAITFNTIRLQVLTRQDEIEVSKLIGATSSFIRRPFLYYGTLQALLGGLLAWVIVTISVYLLNFQLSELTNLYGLQFRLQPFNAINTLSFFIFAALLGWVGALLSVSYCLSKKK